ncbi:hypothetical protein SI65_02158 [Aspergillus cristatus]|uniref:Major facilitator superfamily (MFS) profile domain-containing protein n=1 Tax=Aspergillus cristatus TaxID=573508 RepID=A0A1E3BK26_ASPCR|nr:hypothetical protein SI65_02158 [Aspergillus cristatus]
MLGLMTISVTFASSVFSTAMQPTLRQFGVSQEVMVLRTILFVLGFSFGPSIFGPLSELYGRKMPLFMGLFIFSIFQITVAVAQNLQTIFVRRFLSSVFASAPLAIVWLFFVFLGCDEANDKVGGMLADIFDPVDRATAVAIFAANTFIGPVAGPVVCSFITMSYLGWRGIEYITAIMAFFFATVCFFFVPETFKPVLIQQRAKRLRHETKNWALHVKSEEKPVDVKVIGHNYLLRPIVLIALEPILVLITLYTGFIYRFLYLCFEAYPISFQEERGWNMGVGELPSIAATVRVLCGCGIIIFFTKVRFQSVLEKTGKVIPGERLIPMMIGGVLLPAGVF